MPTPIGTNHPAAVAVQAAHEKDAGASASASDGERTNAHVEEKRLHDTQKLISDTAIEDEDAAMMEDVVDHSNNNNDDDDQLQRAQQGAITSTGGGGEHERRLPQVQQQKDTAEADEHAAAVEDIDRTCTSNADYDDNDEEMDDIEEEQQRAEHDDKKEEQQREDAAAMEATGENEPTAAAVAAPQEDRGNSGPYSPDDGSGSGNDEIMEEEDQPKPEPPQEQEKSRDEGKDDGDEQQQQQQQQRLPLNVTAIAAPGKEDAAGNEEQLRQQQQPPTEAPTSITAATNDDLVEQLRLVEAQVRAEEERILSGGRSLAGTDDNNDNDDAPPDKKKQRRGTASMGEDKPPTTIPPPQPLDSNAAIGGGLNLAPPNPDNVVLGTGLDTLGTFGLQLAPPRLPPPSNTTDPGLSPEEALAQQRKADEMLAEKVRVRAEVRARKEKEQRAKAHEARKEQQQKTKVHAQSKEEKDVAGPAEKELLLKAAKEQEERVVGFWKEQAQVEDLSDDSDSSIGGSGGGGKVEGEKEGKSGADVGVDSATSQQPQQQQQGPELQKASVEEHKSPPNIEEDEQLVPQASMTKQEWERYVRERKKISSLGGPIDTPAYALLTGRYCDPKTDAIKAVSVPLTRIPATIGRTHTTDSPSFFGLGKSKALSRSHAVIYYRDSAGAGTIMLGEEPKESRSILRPAKKRKKSDGKHSNIKAQDIIRPKDILFLPSSGCFIIECLGKNGMTVGGMEIKQGQAALLQHGTTIQMSTYSLYFLLPVDAPSTDVVKMLNPQYTAYQQNRKRMREELEAAEDSEDDVSSDDGSTLSPKPKVKKSPGGQAEAQNQETLAEMEALPTATLLKRFTEAVDGPNAWDRHHHLLNSAIFLHAVQAAARSKKIRKVQKRNHHLQRADIVRWVKTSPVFKEWADTIVDQSERGFDSKIRKGMIKAGYIKTGSWGNMRWLLPADIASDDAEGSCCSSSEEDLDDDGDDQVVGEKRDVISSQAAAIAEIEALPLPALIQQWTEAFVGDEVWTWGNRHHWLNSAVANQAVRAAAHSKEISAAAAESKACRGESSITRKDVLSWIRNSDVFKGWSEHLLDKIEQRSYEAKISRAIEKSGFFTKVGLRGHTRWLLSEELRAGDNGEEASKENTNIEERGEADKAEIHDEGGDVADAKGADQQTETKRDDCSTSTKPEAEKEVVPTPTTTTAPEAEEKVVPTPTTTTSIAAGHEDMLGAEAQHEALRNEAATSNGSSVGFAQSNIEHNTSPLPPTAPRFSEQADGSLLPPTAHRFGEEFAGSFLPPTALRLPEQAGGSLLPPAALHLPDQAAAALQQQLAARRIVLQQMVQARAVAIALQQQQEREQLLLMERKQLEASVHSSTSNAEMTADMNAPLPVTTAPATFKAPAFESADTGGVKADANEPAAALQSTLQSTDEKQSEVCSNTATDKLGATAPADTPTSTSATKAAVTDDSSTHETDEARQIRLAESGEQEFKRQEQKVSDSVEETSVAAATAAKPKKAGTKTRKVRCGECVACTSDDCGTCTYCLDKPKNGGPNRLKKPCKLRTCTNPKITHRGIGAASPTLSAAAAAAAKTKKNKIGDQSKTNEKKIGLSKTMANLVALPTATLMQRLSAACAGEGEWGRNHTQLSTAIALHAVEAAARSKALREIMSKEDGSVARGDVLAWIKSSNEFEVWAALVLNELGPASFDGKVSKAMKDMGYSKTGSPGRPRWILPEGLELNDDGEDIFLRDGSYNDREEPPSIVHAGHDAPATNVASAAAAVRNVYASAGTSADTATPVPIQPAVAPPSLPGDLDETYDSSDDEMTMQREKPRFAEEKKQEQETNVDDDDDDDGAISADSRDKEANRTRSSKVLTLQHDLFCRGAATVENEKAATVGNECSPSSPQRGPVKNVATTQGAATLIEEGVGGDSTDIKTTTEKAAAEKAAAEAETKAAEAKARSEVEANERTEKEVAEAKTRVDAEAKARAEKEATEAKSRVALDEREAQTKAEKDASEANGSAAADVTDVTLRGRRRRRSHDPSAFPSGASELGKKPVAVPNPVLPIISSKKRRKSSDA